MKKCPYCDEPASFCEEAIKITKKWFFFKKEELVYYWSCRNVMCIGLAQAEAAKWRASGIKPKRKIVPHHDSQSYSHYQISQQALRDARKYE